MKKVYSFLCAAVVLSACGGSSKKMIVISKGPAQVSTDAKTIKAADGGAFEDKEYIISSGDATYKTTSPAGEASLSLPGDGLFIVNATSDTIVGGIQPYRDASSQQKAITQDELKQRIDSMILLSEGKNANTSSKTYFILPNQAVKISDNIQATVVAPYHRMRSVEKVDGKDPEVYHFNSLKEFRERIEEMKALTVAPKK